MMPITFEDIPRKILLVTGFNIFQLIFVLTVHPSLILALIGIAVLTINIFLIKKNKLALYLMLLWYAVQSVSITSPYLTFGFTYGFVFHASLTNGSRTVTVYPITIVMFVLLYLAKKPYFHAETDGVAVERVSRATEPHRLPEIEAEGKEIEDKRDRENPPK